MKSRLLFLFVLGFALCGIASASIILDFTGILPKTGDVTFLGGLGTPLTGSEIAITHVTGILTPQHEGESLLITGAVADAVCGADGCGSLDFETGGFIGMSGGVYQFGPGGWITITGGIAELGIPDGTSLMSGQFLGAELDPIEQHLSFFIGLGGDEKDPTLVEYFAPGTPATGWRFGPAFMDVNGGNDQGSAFGPVPAWSVDVSNSIPEPGTMVLLGTALLLLGGVARRRWTA